MERILIVDDDAGFRSRVRAFLVSEPEMEIVGEAADGQEALLKAGDLKPDLVLMDVRMPRMNGLEAIKEIKKQKPETKIIALTVHRKEEYILATMRITLSFF